MHRIALSISPARYAALCLALLAVGIAACDSSDPDEPDDDVPVGLFDEALADPGRWHFVEPGAMQCRDGSDTGFGVRFQDGAENLVIYLEGGGACFNEQTCATNPSSYGAMDFQTAFLGVGRGDAAVFSTASTNPLGDWNAVYVPYCTGDVHGGSARDATSALVPGTQQFVGHLNVERILNVLAPTVGTPGKVLLSGSSAGGFGALVNFPAVADTFTDSETFLVDDSGPIFFDDAVLSPALADGFNALYRLRQAFPSNANALFATDGLQGIYAYLDTQYPDATFGLSSYRQDQTIRGFFGFGQFDGTITGEEYAAGLDEIAATTSDKWGMYFATGEDHTLLPFPDRYAGSVSGTTYSDWLGALLDGTPTYVAP